MTKEHSSRLEKIKHSFESQGGFPVSAEDQEDIQWLINRVERLTEALDLLYKYTLVINPCGVDYPVKLAYRVLKDD